MPDPSILFSFQTGRFFQEGFALALANTRKNAKPTAVSSGFSCLILPEENMTPSSQRVDQSICRLIENDPALRFLDL
ncbi:MAG: hypothetical protein Q8P67_12900, partial [archaeon]|nr:hypothetical protein [archaeon]